MDESGGTVNVIASLDGHSKVVEMHDTDVADYIEFYQDFTEQNYGTVELWARTNDATAGYLFSLMGNSGADRILRLMIQTDKFRYYDGSWHDVGLAASDDTWYHIRMDWEATVGGYSGLAQNKWKVFINGVEYGDYSMVNNDGVDRILITSDQNTAMTNYIDAIGYSWDPNYSVGDNASAYSQVVYRQAKARRGSHESHKDFSAFDITKMIFPEVI